MVVAVISNFFFSLTLPSEQNSTLGEEKKNSVMIQFGSMIHIVSAHANCSN